MKAPSYRFIVTGRVQGVGFRQAATVQAEQLRLRGWVRNCDDGSVEGVIAGDNATTRGTFREWPGRGPRTARVDRLQWREVSDSLPQPGLRIRR